MSNVRVLLNSIFGQFPCELPTHPESLDSTAVDVFSAGNCHTLAAALSKVTGLPLCAVYYNDRREYPFPDHVALLLPDGGYYDVQGYHAPDCGDGIDPYSLEEVDELIEEGYYRPMDGEIPPEVLDRYVRLVLKTHDIKPHVTAAAA